MILQYHEAFNPSHGSEKRTVRGEADMHGITLILIAWALILPYLMPSWAYAHRGFGPAELGIPIWTTVGLAVVCYWIVILWPASKKKDSSASQDKAQDAL